jgi:uncharacterized delta-60 repeat protein
MTITQAIQNLLNGAASEVEIQLIKRLLASGEISIGGNVNQSVIIIGDGNTVELPPSALDRLGARSMLGNLDRDLTGEEIAAGLRRLDKLLPNRAPVLLSHYKEHVGRLRSTLKTETQLLSEPARRERVEALAVINSICVEAVDVSFNGLAIGEEAPKYDSRSPFRGLESFRPQDSEFFFGREALVEKLVGKINAHSFLAVLGASGSGKSSLVMAGVIPALDLDYVIFRPGMNPLGELESARGKSLIMVDQFEELFTLTRDEVTRNDFITRLLDESSRSRIILTLRSDFLGEVGAYRALSEEIQNHLEIIPPMNLGELRLAMEGQADVVGLRFEADLSQQILDDVEGEPGAMPLMQHALWELWNRRHGRNLRAAEYRAFGGVKEAITSTAEREFADCSKPEQDQLRDIFLRLTRLDDSGEGRDTRRRVLLDDLIPSGRDATSITLLLDKLANARLIVKTVNENKINVEVAHEALIRHWERLRDWLKEDRDNLRLRESVSEDARKWANAGKDEILLNHRGGRLDDALSIDNTSRYGFTEIEQSYLRACLSLRNREQREREQRLRWVLIASIGAALIFLTLGGFGWLKSNEANAQAKIALARQLAAQAHLLNKDRGSNQMVASLLAIESMRLIPTGEGARFLINDNHSTFPIAHMDHGSAVYSTVFSPDSKYVVTGSGDNTARVWEVASGLEISRMTHGDTVSSVAFSPDGKYVVSGSYDNTVRVWEVETGKELSRMTHGDTVSSVAFSPDGKYVVSGSSDNTARVWVVETGKELSRITHGDAVSSTAFSPDGKYAVSGSYDHTVLVWNVVTGEEIAHMTHGDAVSSVAFSPDGKYVASGSSDYTARVWEAMTGNEISRMTYFSAVTTVSFSPDSKYVASGAMDRTANVWKVKNGEELARIIHDTPVTSMAFSPDGKYVISGSWDYTARVWEASTGRELAHITHEGRVYSVAFSPNGKYVVTGSSDNTARVWEAVNRQEFTRMMHKGAVFSIAFSPDGSYMVSGSEDGIARVWKAKSREEIVRISHDGAVHSVAFSPDGKYVVSGSGDHTIRVWGAVSGDELTHMLHNDEVISVAFSPDGKYVVSGSLDHTARVWSATSGVEVARMTHGDEVTSVAFSPDSKYIISGSRDKTARVWDAATGEELARVTHHGIVASVAFSPGGKYVISGSGDGIALVWEAATGEEISRMTHDKVPSALFRRVSSVAFGPDGKYAVSGSWDGTVSIWEVISGKELFRMTHDFEVNSVNFSPDGKYIVSGGADRTARVWEVASGKEVARMTHDDHVITAIFSPDSSYVVSTSWDDTARAWEYLPDDLLVTACSFALRNLTHTEWNTFIGDALPYRAICPNLPIDSTPTP